MEHLALEVFDLSTKENPKPTGSKYAVLEPDATITITDTSEIFADGDVWSYDFTLNVRTNAHLFGTAGDIHGSRLHEQINKRKARLWVKGTPLYLGYLKLDDEAEVDAEGNVDVTFESGQKTFEEMIEGTSAQEVSVGDVVIGVALNRKRIIQTIGSGFYFKIDGLEPYAAKDNRLKDVYHGYFEKTSETGKYEYTPYAQRWPKMVKSHGKVYDSTGTAIDSDYTNIQTPYDAGHPFCNINICYPFKVNDHGEEKSGRGYTVRLAHGNPTTHGGDNETRYNNAPNFYLLYFIDRLFKDMNIHISENQALDVEDIRRVFMLNYGCHYEEIEDDRAYFDSEGHMTPDHMTPEGKLSRYGQYYMPLIDTKTEKYITDSWSSCCQKSDPDGGFGSVAAGKVLLRDVEIVKNGETILKMGSLEGNVYKSWFRKDGYIPWPYQDYSPVMFTKEREQALGAYSAYLAYATGENYPNVEISEIVNAMKTMFGVRLIFDKEYNTVRIVLLRNVFRNKEVQDISCDIVGDDVKVENNKRGFRMTYGKGTDDTSFYYKGFSDAFQREATTWKDTTDKHDYTQWELNAVYNELKQHVSAMNKICYVTPVTGNAYIVKVDEEEKVLYPSLFETAGFMDAEDGDCSKVDEKDTIEEVQVGASPVIMNEVGPVYASLFSGDIKAPTPLNTDGKEAEDSGSFYNISTKIATFARITTESVDLNQSPTNFDNGKVLTEYTVKGKLDVYSCEGFEIRMEDNYSISNGGTPFDESDPGLQFGIMRSSGDDARVDYFFDPDDGEGNQAWDVVQGDGAIDHPDTCDPYGNEWDYNGMAEGQTADSDGRFSLKLRAEKPNPFFNPNLPESETNRRYLEITNSRLRQRGLCDQFYKEYSHWIRNARIVRRTVRMTLAQLLTIDKTKRVRVGDAMGFIRKMQYSVSNETGLGNVTLEIMYI